MSDRSIKHVLNHLGENREDYMGSVAPPIFQTSNFAFDTVAEMRKGIDNEFTAPFYTRGYNPTVATLRKKLAALEHADDALVFSSGSAAVAASIMSEVKAGDHIVCVQKPYSWTYNLVNDYLSKYGVESTFVDGRDVQNIKNAIQANTKMVYLESPNSVTFELQDIAAVRAAVGEEMCIAIDNSYCTPIYQNPIDLGANIVIHSASKYLSGHSDIVAGVVCSDQARIDAMFRKEFMTIGAAISPNDAWLLIRGLRTLEMRVNEVSKITEEVMRYLENHPKVEVLNYPFSRRHPQYDLAKKQMKGSGGLFSMQVKADSIAQVETFCNNLPSFLITCSWGGYESLQFPTCVFYKDGKSEKTDLPWNLIRFYIGHEDPKEIIAEFDRAFSMI